MVKKLTIVVILLVLVPLIMGSFSCIKIREAPAPTRPEEASKAVPQETILPKLPTIQAFVKTGTPPGMTPSQFISAREEVEQIFTDRFGIPYYAPRPHLVEYYEPHDLTQLKKAIKDLTKLTNWQYRADYFDCSNMSSLVEYALEAAGFETLIVMGADPTVKPAHAWCIVLLKTPKLELIPIEATIPTIPNKYKPTVFMGEGAETSQSYHDYITRGVVFENIYQAYKYYPREFQWWNCRQIDMAWFERSVPTDSAFTFVVPPGKIVLVHRRIKSNETALDGSFTVRGGANNDIEFWHYSLAPDKTGTNSGAGWLYGERALHFGVSPNHTVVLVFDNSISEVSNKTVELKVSGQGWTINPPFQPFTPRIYVMPVPYHPSLAQ